MNVITSLRVYKTVANARKALERSLAKDGLTLADVRWFVGVAAQDDERFVPCLVGEKYVRFAQLGIMVVG